MAQPKYTGTDSVTVAKVSVLLEDSRSETNLPARPTHRLQWPAAAHAPTVLSFEPYTAKFKDLPSDAQRLYCATIAHRLTGLGKGARVSGQIVKDQQGRPIRSIAYTDAIAMGEPVTMRSRFLKDDKGASSCAMLVRSVLKMIGVKAASFDKVYADGKVFEELSTIANLANGGDPGVIPGAEEPYFDSSGAPVMGSNGKQVKKKKMPKLGDIVVIADDKNGQAHTFIPIFVQSPDSSIVQKNGRVFAPKQWYMVVQGGQRDTPQFPDDGGCMGTNERMNLLNSANWIWDHAAKDENGKAKPRKVIYWIDVERLAAHCDDDVIVMPTRVMAW